MTQLDNDANQKSTPAPIHIIGGGMAGCEAAWQAANLGVPVILHEMRPVKKTEAHQTDGLAELVCSNSFRSDDFENNAVGLLHEEMRRANGLIISTAHDHQIPAGSALAVDRDGFSQDVTAKIEAHPLISIEREEVPGIPPAEWDSVIIATGPLTSASMGEAIKELTGEDELSFFDAIAPIVYYDSIDMSKAWRQSRYDKPGPSGETDAYVNCPMNEEQYLAFLKAMNDAPKTEFKEWEKDTPYFEGCLPVEVMASRGPETLRYGPLKPVGLTNAHQPDIKAHAIVQLRQDNKLGTLWNIVGFQTKMTYGSQKDVLRMIPGLENAEFARLGGIHRNTFINSPKVLNNKLQLKNHTRIRFAGQVSGVEGYVESAAMGLLAGRFAAFERLGKEISPPPETTALGSLIAHVTGGHLIGKATFQPMNVNFGLFPDIDFSKVDPETGKKFRGKDKSRAKKRAQSARALKDIQEWLRTQS